MVSILLDAFAVISSLCFYLSVCTGYVGVSFPWPLSFIDAAIHAALKELAADFGSEEALPVSQSVCDKTAMTIIMIIVMMMRMTDDRCFMNVVFCSHSSS
jgi:hypothetical protein